MRGKKEAPAVLTTERCLLAWEISLLSAIAPALTVVDIVLGCNTLETEISKKDGFTLSKSGWSAQ